MASKKPAPKAKPDSTVEVNTLCKCRSCGAEDHYQKVTVVISRGVSNQRILQPGDRNFLIVKINEEESVLPVNWKRLDVHNGWPGVTCNVCLGTMIGPAREALKKRADLVSQGIYKEPGMFDDDTY